MGDPFRHRSGLCPVCGSALRPFGARLCCDRCEAIFVTADDLRASIEEVIVLPCALSITDHGEGALRCPECGGAMAHCKIVVTLDDMTAKPKVELSRCAAHGLWFGEGQLAEVVYAAERAFPRVPRGRG